MIVLHVIKYVLHESSESRDEGRAGREKFLTEPNTEEGRMSRILLQVLWRRGGDDRAFGK